MTSWSGVAALSQFCRSSLCTWEGWVEPYWVFCGEMVDRGGHLRPGTLRDRGWHGGGDTDSGIGCTWRELDYWLDAAVGGLGEGDLHGGDKVRLRINFRYLLRDRGWFILWYLAKALCLKGFWCYLRGWEGVRTRLEWCDDQCFVVGFVIIVAFSEAWYGRAQSHFCSWWNEWWCCGWWVWFGWQRCSR